MVSFIFIPSIGLISIGQAGAVLKSSMPIKFSSTINASGLPIAAGKVGSSGEVPLTDATKFEPNGKTNFSDYGLDTEAIALDTARGVFWVLAGRKSRRSGLGRREHAGTE